MHAERLRQLGALMTLDLLINNVDRLPLLWENDGNRASRRVLALLPAHAAGMFCSQLAICCLATP